MGDLVRVPLEGGGTILFEAPAQGGGPVKAGKFTDSVRELPQTLQSVLVPVRDAAEAVLEQLRKARPDEVEVEFGVDLAAEAGAVIAKTESSCHLQVRLLWSQSAQDPDQP